MLGEFCLLLQAAVGKQVALPRVLTDKEWKAIFALAKKQALSGIVLEGVKRLPKEQWPKADVVMAWTLAAETIRRQNMKTTDVCLELTKALERDGFEVCILKGQANHVYYDALGTEQPLGQLRNCGDIDAWIWPKEGEEHPVKSIIDYCRHKDILLSLCHLHAEVKPVKGVPVEIHFRPSFLNAPWRDRAFQRLFRSAVFETAEVDGMGTVRKLRADYDVVFQMNHIYRHLLDEGVGMRQVLDFYVLLREYNRVVALNEGLMSREVLLEQIGACGMRRFASALMYVLQEMFGMEEGKLLCRPSHKHGTFLLDEMMAAGNFGHYDERMKVLEVKKGRLSYQLQRAQRRFSRNLRFLTSYPEEVICEPVARAWHFAWRKLGMYRF